MTTELYHDVYVKAYNREDKDREYHSQTMLERPDITIAKDKEDDGQEESKKKKENFDDFVLRKTHATTKIDQNSLKDPVQP